MYRGADGRLYRGALAARQGVRWRMRRNRKRTCANGLAPTGLRQRTCMERFQVYGGSASGAPCNDLNGRDARP
ncbi:protein of unknown function [Azospirillum lipoferum 4B]|uniref:Uncharacterized protein n=1 Tax=Azospirillum lipoferum (strain 4B) TaxID=862719 RepID=G7Z5V1_AZOL4|nr:protein of unknown function [Azospirillum lipoferum 4B]